MTKALSLPFCFVVLATAPEALALTATLNASKDNTIFRNVPDNSAGGAAGIFAGTAGVAAGGAPRRGLIAFDVASAAPAGANITGASLTLHLALAGGGGMRSIGLHKLAADWGEGNAGDSLPTVSNSGNGFPTNPGDATWDSRFHGATAWTNPGGDFAAAASASALVGTNFDGAYAWLSTPALVSDVQNWLDNPATNFGWALVNANETSLATVRAFYSRSATLDGGGDPLDPAMRPLLTIEYVIPEPTTMALLALAGPLVLLMRRR